MPVCISKPDLHSALAGRCGVLRRVLLEYVEHHLGRPLAAGAIPVTFGVQLDGDFREGRSMPLWRLLSESPHARHGRAFGREMSVGFDTFDALAAVALPLASRTQFQHQHVLLKFGDSAQDLPNQRACRIVVAARQVYAIARQDANADLLELPDDHFLNHQTDAPVDRLARR